MAQSNQSTCKLLKLIKYLATGLYNLYQAQLMKFQMLIKGVEGHLVTISVKLS